MILIIFLSLKFYHYYIYICYAVYFTILASLESSLESGDVGHLLDFAPHTAKPQPAVPEDLRTALFASIEDAQTVVLPKPQLNAVISSYEKTIGNI